MIPVSLFVPCLSGDAAAYMRACRNTLRFRFKLEFSLHDELIVFDVRLCWIESSRGIEM